ncbi:hypothetical protein [Streptomyces sp. NPDC056817]|uniref:hypothetical protein n=1 Tax=Streptomyces sp. NPDC056817 TaxID=3345950 RepID=UPI00369E02AE
MTAVPQTAVEPPLPAGTRPVPGYRILGHLARTGRLDLYGCRSDERACRCVIEVLRSSALAEVVDGCLSLDPWPAASSGPA